MAPSRKQLKQMMAARVSAPGKMMERASIPTGYISPGNSPFLKNFLAKYIRDKIYDKLLIVQRTPEDQAKYDKYQNVLATGESQFECEFALDMLNQDYMLVPDMSAANKGTQFIGRNKGILTANKQIYEEATTTLFGKNLFGAVPQSERVQAFWRCGTGCRCEPSHRPCQARPETFAKIKHLYLIVSVVHPDDKVTDLSKTIKTSKTNLTTIVDTLKESGNHLLTLTIRYWSHFGGEFEAVRDSLEGPLPRGMSKRPPAMIRHSVTGKFHQITAENMQKTVFKDIYMLDSLKTLKGVADYVNIRGDLPCEYRDVLKITLSSADPGAGGKKLRKAEAEAAQKRPKPSGGIAGFAAEKLAANDPDMTPALRDLYEQLSRTSTKSPAVMSTFLYDGSMRELPPLPQEQAPPQPPVVVPTGGIGVIDGKAVFGPVRLPGM